MLLNTYQRAWFSKHSVIILSAVFLLLLLCKFFWSLFYYSAPLGYDPGFYRYLFIRHADGFPPFWLAPMDGWAKGHPLGLFFFSTLLLKLGVPVSWLLGWIWNLFPVVLAAVFAWVIGRREGKMTGVLVLLTAFLSIAYFDGFAAMYWKTYASLLWCVVTYRLIEKKSWWAILTGILCVATHHQTGLLFGLAFGSWLFTCFIGDARTNLRAAFRTFLPFFLGGCVIVLIGVLWYLPVWKDAILSQLPALLKGEQISGGSFPPALFYLQTEGILLALGAVGFGLSIKRERLTLWQLSVLWSLLFVVARLLFYRRFFLQLDFFLLPFAAIAIRAFWMRFSRPVYRGVLVCALLVQAAIMISVMPLRGPMTDPADFDAINTFADHIPADALIIGLDNKTVTQLRGWLPYARIAGPGLFDNAWTYSEWETFLMGTHEDRVRMLSIYSGTVYIYVSQFFQDYYGESVAGFMSDPCFTPTEYPRFFTVSCLP